MYQRRLFISIREIMGLILCLLLFHSCWRSRLTILLCLSVLVFCVYASLAQVEEWALKNTQMHFFRKIMLWGECERGFSSWHCAVQNIPFLLASEHPSWVWGGVQSRACWEAHYPAALRLSDAIKQQAKRMEELVNLSHPACSEDYWCCIIHQSMTDLVVGSAARGVQLLLLLQLPIKNDPCLWKKPLTLCLPMSLSISTRERITLALDSDKMWRSSSMRNATVLTFPCVCNVLEVGKYWYFLCNSNPGKF